MLRFAQHDNNVLERERTRVKQLIPRHPERSVGAEGEAVKDHEHNRTPTLFRTPPIERLPDDLLR